MKRLRLQKGSFDFIHFPHSQGFFWKVPDLFCRKIHQNTLLKTTPSNASPMPGHGLPVLDGSSETKWKSSAIQTLLWESNLWIPKFIQKWLSTKVYTQVLKHIKATTQLPTNQVDPHQLPSGRHQSLPDLEEFQRALVQSHQERLVASAELISSGLTAPMPVSFLSCAKVWSCNCK